METLLKILLPIFGPLLKLDTRPPHLPEGTSLVRASKSDTLMQLYGAMATLLARSHRNRRLLVGEPRIQQEVVDDHRRLLEAVISGDEDAADHALRHHFRIGDELRRRKALAVEPASGGTKPRKTKETTS